MRKMNLSIPNPCHEDWDQMTPSERGRFCNFCQKNVFDFTAMSDRELIGFFKKSAGRVCGRFHPDQLNRDLVLPRKPIPWIKYFFQFVLPAFLVSLKTSAQKEQLEGKVGLVYNKEIKGDTIKVQQESLAEITREIRGRVKNRSGVGVSYATVVIKGTGGGVACDSTGYFKIQCNESRLVLVASAIGFVSKEFVVGGSSFTEIILDEAQLSGEVVIAGMVIPKPSKSVSLIKKIVDTAFSRFSIYPNPVSQSSSFIINTKKMERADYVISVVNNDGEIIQSGIIRINKKNQTHSFQLRKMIPGGYFIQLFNKKSGKTFTEKLIVQ